MIVEMRTYTLHVGRLQEFVEQYRSSGFALQCRYLGEPLGWYLADGGALSQVVSLWRYLDHEDRASRRERLAADAQWQAYLQRVSPLFQAMENRFLSPAALAA